MGRVKTTSQDYWSRAFAAGEARAGRQNQEENKYFFIDPRFHQRGAKVSRQLIQTSDHATQEGYEKRSISPIWRSTSLAKPLELRGWVYSKRSSGKINISSSSRRHWTLSVRLLQRRMR